MEPIAKRLKQSAESALLPASSSRKAAAKVESEEDIAERIRRLEAELDGNGSNDSSSESEDESSSSSSEDEDDGAARRPGAVLSLSKYAADRVEALPETQLPPRRASAAALEAKASKKRKLPAMSAAHQALMDIVHVPKRVPFACRRCGFVGSDLAALEAHRQTPAHLAVEQLELRCDLCAKSFTSQAQVDEHRAGKWHQQRAKQKKERHVVRVCYDFMRGACKFGDRCGFEHAATKAVRSGKALDRKKQRACAQFAAGGACKFGDRCLFSHEAAA
ncbi:hypothetical protein PybrP1_013197 [[Pythium] brassicae (nom. inval.)]|nr:hypothetical protein PybrP1_013197 [[Pythium] brassicae (nom. inval.)]